MKSNRSAKRRHSISDLIGQAQDDTDRDAGLLTQSPPSTNSRTTRQVRKKRRNSKPTVTSNKAMDDAIDAVATQPSNDDHDISNSDDTEYDNNNPIIMKLQSTIEKQQVTIDNLNSQVKFLLSYLGITSVPHGPANIAQNSLDNNINSFDVHSSNMSTVVSVTQSNVKSAITETIVSAVYNDQYTRERRANSLVVTGLPAIPNNDDKNTFIHLCSTELGAAPRVKTCRRLGKPTTGKIQPLLVAMETVDEAKHILLNAKRLRQSTNERVRRQTYINPNLTKAESLAAYIRRCQRRDRRTDQVNSHVDQNNTTVQRGGGTPPTVIHGPQPTTAATTTASTVNSATAAVITVTADVHHHSDEITDVQNCS